MTHAFSGTKDKSGKVYVNGSFDVNVWYSYDQDKKTAVATKKFNYTDTLNVPIKSDANIDSASEIIVRCLHQPTVSNVSIKDGNVLLDIEKEMGVEIIGDAKVKISVEEDFDDYEEIDEDIEEVVSNVDENYLDKD